MSLWRVLATTDAGSVLVVAPPTANSTETVPWCDWNVAHGARFAPFEPREHLRAQPLDGAVGGSEGSSVYAPAMGLRD
jgi:hypothetical protein